MLAGSGVQPVSLASAQLRAISPSIIAQLFAALQGGCVAGDTSRQIATRFAAATAPISASQERIGGAVDAFSFAGRAVLVGLDDGARVAVCGVRSGVGPHALTNDAAAISQFLLNPVLITIS